MKNLPGIQKWVKLKKGFEPYVSPSKLNLFRNSPSMFACRYGFGAKGQSSPAMWRGIYIEDAVVEVLTEKKSIEEAIKGAQDKFKKKYFMFDDRVEREYKVLDPMIQNSCEALDGFGIPEFDNGRQKKIEFDISDDDWSIGGMGYLDLVFPNGQIVDLKTTHMCPSTMSADHQLQRAFYKTAMSNYQCRFLYVTKSKAVFLEDGDEVDVMNDAKILIKKLDNFCNTLTPDQARKAIPISGSDYYWNGEDNLRNFYNEKE